MEVIHSWFSDGFLDLINVFGQLFLVDMSIVYLHCLAILGYISICCPLMVELFLCHMTWRKGNFTIFWISANYGIV